MPAEHVHFVGIGGAGMSAIAGVLMQQGVTVSGSDLEASDTTERLRQLGAHVSIGHAAGHIAGADRVVVSTAIPPDNVEVEAAKSAGIPIWHRSEILAELLNARASVAVAGTHGKTTVTSMIAWILDRAGRDPSFIIGGTVAELGAARCGGGPNLVAEADESDRSFLRYKPLVSVITNIEPDHLEHYDGNFDLLVEAFRTFALNLRQEGLAVIGADDRESAKLAAYLAGARGPEHVQTFGIEGGDWRAMNIELADRSARFIVAHGSKRLGPVRLMVPGRHNVQNALAAMAATAALGVDPTEAALALGSFAGAKRRFQLVGEVNGISLYDDYAHNPTKVRATLKACREGWRRRVVAVFQPHRYVRTKFLMNDFAQSFGDADEIILTEVYAPPPDAPIPGVSGERLARLIAQHEGREVIFAPTLDDVIRRVAGVARPGDLIVTMGAGDIYRTGPGILDALRTAWPSGRQAAAGG